MKISFDESQVDQFWRLDLNGQLMVYDQSQLTIDIDSTTPSEAYLGSAGLCNNCIEGAISGILVDPGDAISSGFKLRTVDTETVETVDGMMLLTR